MNYLICIGILAEIIAKQQNAKGLRCWYKFYNYNKNGLQAVSQMELIEKIVNGCGRTILEHRIDGGLYERQGKAITNFQLIIRR